MTLKRKEYACVLMEPSLVILCLRNSNGTQIKHLNIFLPKLEGCNLNGGNLH